MLSARPLCVWECWRCFCLCGLTNPALRGMLVEKGWEMTSPSTLLIVIDESREQRSSSIKASPEIPQTPAIDEQIDATRPYPGVE